MLTQRGRKGAAPASEAFSWKLQASASGQTAHGTEVAGNAANVLNGKPFPLVTPLAAGDEAEFKPAVSGLYYVIMSNCGLTAGSEVWD